MPSRLLARVLTAFAALLIATPALAYDATRAPRYASPDMYRPNVDRIVVNGIGTTVSTLRARDALPLVDGANVRTAGYASVGDQGSADYTWSATSTAADDGCAVIKPTGVSGAGRWLLSVSGPIVNVRQCGAVGDGVTDDTAAFQKAAAYLSARGGGTIVFMRRHAIKSSWTLFQGVSLQGPGQNADPGNPFYFNLAGYNDPRRTGYLAAMRTGPGLVIDPSVTISLGGRQVVDGSFYSSALKLDGTDVASSFAGSPFFGQFIDSVTFRGTLVGFAQGLYFDETSRLKIDVVADCTNVLKTYRAFDVFDIQRVHAFNLISAASGTDASSLRHGIAVWLTGQNAGPRLGNVLAYGYDVALKIEGPGGATINQFWAEGPIDATTKAPLNPSSIGAYLDSGTSSNTTIDPDKAVSNIQFMAPKFYSQGTAIVVNGGNYGAVTLTNPVFQHNDKYGDIGGLGLQVTDADADEHMGPTGWNFTNAQAANTAVLRGGVISGSKGANKILTNEGGGKVKLSGWRYLYGDRITRYNVGVTVVAITSGQNLTIPDDEDVTTVFVSGGGNIGNMGERWPGRRVTVVFKDATTTPSAGSSFFDDASTGNFKTKGGFLATAGSSITFVFDANLNKWSEVARTLY